MKNLMLLAATISALLLTSPAWTQSIRTTNPAELPKVFAGLIRVADLDQSERFYHQVFGAKVIPVHERERAVEFSSGVRIILVQGPTRETNEPLPQGAGGFLMQVADMGVVLANVESAGGTIQSTPTEPMPSQPTLNAKAKNAADKSEPKEQNAATQALAAGLRVAMISDPDGVRIEVIQFPSAQ